jgi:hypothetical protein
VVRSWLVHVSCASFRLAKFDIQTHIAGRVT